MVRMPEAGLCVFMRLNPAALPEPYQSLASAHPDLVNDRIVLVHISRLSRIRNPFPNCGESSATFEVSYNVVHHQRALRAIFGKVIDKEIDELLADTKTPVQNAEVKGPARLMSLNTYVHME